MRSATSHKRLPPGVPRMARGARTVEGFTAAARIGISVAAYQAQRAAGNLWCSTCRAFHPRTDFYVDRSRSTGRWARCKASIKAAHATPNHAASPS